MIEQSNFKLALFGVHGVGKSTVATQVARELNASLPVDEVLWPIRMTNHVGLIAYLAKYAAQAREIQNSPGQTYVSSRLGLLDVAVYAVALRELGTLTPDDCADIIARVERLRDDWPAPCKLVHLTASIEVLKERLHVRSQNQPPRSYDEGALRSVHETYTALVDHRDPIAEELRSLYRDCESRCRVVSLDTTGLTAREVAAACLQFVKASSRDQRSKKEQPCA